MPKVNKSELCRRILERQKAEALVGHLTTSDVKLAISKIFETMAENLSMGERIEIRGFGSLFLRERKARWVRNPKTRQKTLLQARSISRFSAGKTIKKAVRDQVRSKH